MARVIGTLDAAGHVVICDWFFKVSWRENLPKTSTILIGQRAIAHDFTRNFSVSICLSRFVWSALFSVLCALSLRNLLFLFLFSQELDVGRISIRVINYGKLFTTTIGAFQYGMADVYAKPGHEVSRQWIALADTNDPEAVGVRVRVCVCARIHSAEESFTSKLHCYALFLDMRNF